MKFRVLGTPATRQRTSYQSPSLTNVQSRQNKMGVPEISASALNNQGIFVQAFPSSSFLQELLHEQQIRGHLYLVFCATLPHLRRCPISPLVQFVQFFRTLARKESHRESLLRCSWWSKGLGVGVKACLKTAPGQAHQTELVCVLVFAAGEYEEWKFLFSIISLVQGQVSKQLIDIQNSLFSVSFVDEGASHFTYLVINSYSI